MYPVTYSRNKKENESPSTSCFGQSWYNWRTVAIVGYSETDWGDPPAHDL